MSLRDSGATVATLAMMAFRVVLIKMMTETSPVLRVAANLRDVIQLGNAVYIETVVELAITAEFATTERYVEITSV